jgi:CxxC-x17-CxxC domain-containing protein
MEYVDRLLICSDCNNEFIFSAGEQLFFFDKQFRNDPRHCKACRLKRAGKRLPEGSGPQTMGFRRTETRAICAKCEVETILPFKPTKGRPVLCRQCFQAQTAPESARVESEMQMR